MSTSAGEYVCTLNEKSKQKARNELNEVEKDRDGSVEAFTSWIKQQKWLTTPTDYAFLLRFLRVRKFSQLSARESIERYWKNKAKANQWFGQMDPADPEIQEILRTGFHIVLPFKDKEGRRIMIDSPGALTSPVLKKHNRSAVTKAMLIVHEWLNRDENLQVNGLVFISDQMNVTLEHFNTVMSPEHVKKLVPCILDTLPYRMKEMYVYREASFFDALFVIIKQFMKPKLRDRVNLIGWNLKELYKKIDKSLLPVEYLPDDYDGPNAGKISDIVENMIADMNSPDFREYIRDLTSDKYGLDLSKKPSEIEVPAASFRKLNIE